MYILDQRERAIMNTAYIGHYNIAIKGSAAMIMAYETGVGQAFTIGAYDGMQEAQKALKGLFVSSKENKEYKYPTHTGHSPFSHLPRSPAHFISS